MNRRKFVLGLGAASASGSALIGSGAFTSVSAERDIAVSTAGDDKAFLRLGACTGEDGELPNGSYVDQGEDGLFSISLSGDNSSDPPAGSGVNQYAISRFDNVFEICNQGTQSVCVDFAVDVPVIPNGAEVPDRFDFGDGDLAVVFYRGSNPDDPINVDDLNADRQGAFPLDVGDCQCVGIEVRAFGFETDEDLFEGAELEIVADADADCSDSPTDAPSDDPEPTYADTVVSSTQGKTAGDEEIEPSRSDPTNALNAPNGNPEFFSLGFKPDDAGEGWDWDGGGRLVVGFDEELMKRPFGTDVLDIETTFGSDDYPEEKALVEVAGSGTDGDFVKVGTATNKASGGENTFELPAEPISKVRLTDQSDPDQSWPNENEADGFDVRAIGGYPADDGS